MADAARATMDEATIEVMECEEEIKSIKKALKFLTMGVNAESAKSSSNRLQVSVHRIAAAGGEGGDVPAAASVAFKVHLSSPVEECTLARLHDPLNPSAEGSLAAFEAVEISNALLTVEVYSDGEGASPPNLVGASAPHDLLPLCQDAELWKRGGEKKTSRVEMAIVAERGMDNGGAPRGESLGTGAEEAGSPAEEAWEDAVSSEIEEGPERNELADEKGASDKDPDNKEKEVNEESSSKYSNAEESTEQPADFHEEKKTAELQLPLYTLTVQLEYTPSPKDRRDALYDQLNAVSKRKVAALNALRKHAAAVNRAKAAEEGGTRGDKDGRSAGGAKNPAVKSGFLNRSSKGSFREETRPPFWKRWYEKTLGPQSLLWVVGPTAKNYILFAGVSLFIHYKGDLLALPAPV